jgi:glycosyltransferase involved in cell wall biosynthesis
MGGKLQICHIIDTASANPLLFDSIRFSDRNRIDHTVISLAPAGELQIQMKELGVRSFSLDYTSRRRALSVFRRLYSILRGEKIDIVQTHLFDASLLGLSAALMARTPVRVFTGHHSHETPLHHRYLLTALDGANGRFLANHVIAPSRQMKEIFVQDLRVPEKKVSVIHHGLDLKSWRAAGSETKLREELEVGEKMIFLAAGRLFWVKDLVTLIEGFAAAVSDRDDAVLVIAGGGDDTQLRTLIASKELAGKVFLLGPRKDIASVMNACDVFVHTSIAESFGMVYIEAFALGKPIICTPTGIAPDIVRDGENGYLIPAGDHVSLAEAMTKMLDDRDRTRAMGVNGRQTAENFAVQKTQAVCDEFYLKWFGER